MRFPNRTMLIPLIVGGWMSCGVTVSLRAQESDTAAESVRFFETRIRPLLAEHCVKCHGPEKQWASFRLDSRESILQGGDSGAAAVPGDPDHSRLIIAVRHTDENLQMPPDNKLSDGEIADLEKWVKLGLVFPGPAPSPARSRNPDHWAFQPYSLPPIPEVVDTHWPAGPLDRFILSRLEQQGIRPADRASREDLVRRLFYDLTGLPPAANDVQNFVADDSPDAYSRLVERLLQSPAYGEHWGRHWLDVARYADSNGLDENIAHGNAWRYRDYVVAALNDDMPMDQFIREQLAGDLLPAENADQRQRQVTATGFLSIGPKVLAEVNQLKMQMDMVDEQVDTMGRVFLGMTFGCARCHDHKFDPISAADYYALAGIFKSTRTMDTYTKVARWHEHEFPTDESKQLLEAHQTSVEEKKQAIMAATDEAVRQKLQNELAELEKSAPQTPSAMGVTDDAVVDLAIHLRGNPLKLGDVVQRRTPLVMRGPPPPAFPASQSGRVELADWLTDSQHPLTARVFVNRVWRWHFGRGLVGTTDNFGTTGEMPSHPELLNWLACQLVESGWSLKQLHRIILNSATWQQSAHVSAEQVSADADNRWFGRARIRRLSAEELRDSLLAVSGQLDPKMGGSLLKVPNRGYLFDHTSIDLTDYSSHRRALYLPVIRNNVYDFFQLLDFPDPALPNGDRKTTTVAPQALLMMNSDLVMQCSDAVAAQVIPTAADDTTRLVALYRLVLARNPSSSETHSDLNFLNEAEQSLPVSDGDEAVRRSRAWSLLCQVLLSSNEFLYLQ